MLTMCIDWPGSKRNGYGTKRAQGKNSVMQAHRWVYENVVGPIPKELTLDHLCRNRACINPVHLEPVPRGVNQARALWYSDRNRFCGKGHEFTPENTWIRKDRGHRVCRQCTGCPPAIGSSDTVIGGEPKRTPEEMELDHVFVTHEGDVLHLTEAIAREYTIRAQDFLDRYLATRRGHQGVRR